MNEVRKSHDRDEPVAATERVATVYGRDYNLTRWPYGTLRPAMYAEDEQWIEEMIEWGFATARLLYWRGVYTAAEMEIHMDAAVDAPLFGSLCPHRILPDNCRFCCGRDAEYWMGP